MRRIIEEIKQKLTIKRVISALIFIIIAAITFYIVFKNNNISEIIANVSHSKKRYLLVGIICMFIYLLCEAINIRRILTNLKDKVTIGQAFKYSLVGFFFSSITPSSTGGQPMQLYFMSKDKLSVSHSALALLVQLLSFQFITLFLALLGFIFHFNLLINHIGNIKYLMFFGITINIIIQSFLIIMIFSQKLGLKLINVFTKFLKKIHFKKADDFHNKALVQLEEYHQCALYLKTNKLMIIKIFFTTLIQLSIYHSIPYFVYLSLGLNKYNIFTFILIEAVLYIAVASLPLPGAMGASEGGFMIVFKIFFPATILGSAMIISRGISFYLFIILSAILIFAFMIYDRRKKTKGYLRK